MYHVYWCTGWYTGTDGTLVFSLFPFLPLRPLQHFDPQKVSGIPPTADVDFVGVFQIVGSLVLLQVGGQCFLGQRIQGVSPAKHKCRAVPNLDAALHGVWGYWVSLAVWE